MKPLVFNLPTQVPYNGSSVCYGCCLHAKTRAAGELASLTDEKPAHDSTGRCGLVD